MLNCVSEKLIQTFCCRVKRGKKYEWKLPGFKRLENIPGTLLDWSGRSGSSVSRAKVKLSVCKWISWSRSQRKQSLDPAKFSTQAPSQNLKMCLASQGGSSSQTLSVQQLRAENLHLTRLQLCCCRTCLNAGMRIATLKGDLVGTVNTEASKALNIR